MLSNALGVFPLSLLGFYFSIISIALFLAAIRQIESPEKGSDGLKAFAVALSNNFLIHNNISTIAVIFRGKLSLSR